MDASITECSFDSQVTWVIDELCLFVGHVIDGCLDNQALTDVRFSGAGSMYSHVLTVHFTYMYHCPDTNPAPGVEKVP